MARLLKLLLFAALLGLINGVLFLGFEYIVNHGTEFIWNNLFNSDEVRWLVIPVAILLSVIYSITVRFFDQKRLVRPHLNPLDSSEEKESKIPSLYNIGAIFVIGAVSLLAGASLGPEASLVAVCSGMGLLIAARIGNKSSAKLLALSGVSSLLVAFFGSILPVLLAFLILYQKQKKVTFAYAVPFVCGVATFAFLKLTGHADGFGEVPLNTSISFEDYAAAFILGALCTPLANTLKRWVTRLYKQVKKIHRRLHWLSSAAIFGCVLGALYLLGGETVQFSGKTGTVDLLSSNNAYGTLALVGLLLVKLAVTGWSLASGYRGGMVFPSVYMGIVLSLILQGLFTNLSETGLAVGSIAGIFSAILGSPLVSLIMVASLLKLNLVGLAAIGIAGSVVSQQAFNLVRNKM